MLFNLEQTRRAAGKGMLHHWCCVTPPGTLSSLLLLLVLVPLAVLGIVLTAPVVVPWIVAAKTCKPRALVKALPMDWRVELGLEQLDFCEVTQVAQPPAPPPPPPPPQLPHDTSRMVLESSALPWAGYPHVLDCGLYWFGRGGTRCSKGVASEFFDSAKPSVIYVHGWEPGSVARGYRESINWRVFDPRNKAAKTVLSEKANCVDLWLDRGFNVGIFYWDQFSDEPSVKVAERKVYNSALAPGFMRWKTQAQDGSVRHWRCAALEQRCVAQMAADEYAVHFGFARDAVVGAGARPAKVHLVGHSLGSQVVLEMCRRLVLAQACATPAAQVWLPDRVSLLDPFFSAGRKPYAPHYGRRVAQRVTETLHMLRELPYDVAIETYVTSLIGVGFMGENVRRLKKLTHHQVVHPAFSTWAEVVLRHVVTPHLYFSSVLESAHNITPFSAHYDEADVLRSTPVVAERMRESDAAELRTQHALLSPKSATAKAASDGVSQLQAAAAR